MTAARDLTPYCAAAACDLNLAGWPHVPWTATPHCWR